MAVFGRILLWILILLLVLLLIAVIRALGMKMPAPGARKACSVDQAGLDAYAAQFGSLLKIRTISKNEEDDLSQFDRLHEQIDKLFPLCAKTLTREVHDGTLLYHWQGRDAKALPILLMGHQDVVPASEEGWTCPPFAGEVKDGVLYGRGTLDDKCNIFTQMSAIEQLLKEGFVPACDVWLEYSINEEISGHGAANAVKWFQSKGIRFAIVLDEGGAVVDRAMPGMDRPYAVVGITEKGYIDVKITAKGSGGHSSAPRKSTCVTRLTSFMDEVNRKQPFRRHIAKPVKDMFTGLAPSFSFPMRLILGNLWLFEPLLVKVLPAASAQAGALLGTTCCFTMMKGSEAPNVIPSEAYVVANLRPGFEQGVQESLAVLKRYADRYDLQMEVLSQRECSPITPTDTAVYHYLEQCIRECYPDCGCSPYVMTGGTDCRWYPPVSGNCLRFAPIRMSAKQMGSCHGIDECVDLPALSDGIDFYKHFLRGWQNQQ